MAYQEGNTYKLQAAAQSGANYYEHITLTCTWVTCGTAYFKLDSNDMSLGSDNNLSNYRLDIKSKRLHHWNSKCMSWDLIGNTLSEVGAEAVWSKRQAYTAYDSMNQGD